MKAQWISAWILGIVLCAGLGFGAEMGRQPVQQGTAIGRTSPVDAQATYRDIMAEGAIGAEADLHWNSVSWDVGSQSYSAAAWTPQVALFYGINRFCDVRATAKFMSVDDDGAELSAVRAGVGPKFWFSTGTDFLPYASVLLNYYTFSSDDVDDVEGTFGLSGEAGIAYLASDSFLVRVGVTAETLLGDASATDILGQSADVSVSALGFGLGLTFLF